MNVALENRIHTDLKTASSPVAETHVCVEASPCAAALPTHDDANRMVTSHFRCPPEFVRLSVADPEHSATGYFRFGSSICYGRCSGAVPSARVAGSLYDALPHVSLNDASVQLPFDPAAVIDNLRHERYIAARSHGRAANRSGRLVRSLYYLARPFLSVSLRKHLQRIYLRDWKRIAFPQWPVDSTVDGILEQLLALSMRAQGLARMPFIWFWPDGAPSCTSVTHDVETAAGLEYTPQLMDVDDSYGIKSAFQIVPEERYTVHLDQIEQIKRRGFEVNVHDLNHDGNLITDRDEFLRRAEEINRHGRRFGARGFRAGVLYRNLDWYRNLEFDYEMSVPNVAHLDPQRGGCCTVFPFFNGHMLELPVTMAQDYALLHILNDYSIDLWKEQISRIGAKHGFADMIVHPDYISDPAALPVYRDLLAYLADLGARGETWIALPAEVADWWRQRNAMRLVSERGIWRIEGEGAHRARIAYAVLDNDQLTYELDPSA